MPRTLTINQTYHVNGCDVEAQLDPSSSPAVLILWVTDGQGGYRRLEFVQPPKIEQGNWLNTDGSHPDQTTQTALCKWVNLDPNALCNGLYYPS